MNAVQWDDSLAIGVDVIDEQHKALIEKLNDTAKAISAGEGEREITKSLGFLIDYTDFHFSAEEGHMERLGYPALEEHKAQHAHFKATLSELERDFDEEGSTKNLADAIHAFLFNWLVKHIQGIDQEFARFLHEKGARVE